MTSDRLFKECVARAAKHLASKNTSPVHFYEFGYRGKYTLSNQLTRAGHSDGLGKKVQFQIKKRKTQVDIRMIILFFN